jgi:hypothetical protein
MNGWGRQTRIWVARIVLLDLKNPSHPNPRLLSPIRATSIRVCHCSFAVNST